PTRRRGSPTDTEAQMLTLSADMDESSSLLDLLECSVCLERLDTTAKVLPCQHTFCRRCLENIVSSRNERCPECRILVDCGVDDLPANILLVRLLDGIKQRPQRANGGGGGSTAGDIDLSANGSSLVIKGSRDVQHFQPGLQDRVLSWLQKRRLNIPALPCGKALYSYEGKEPGDLQFSKGDIIILRRKVDDNWYHGELNGCHGFLPASYIQLLVRLLYISLTCSFIYQTENISDVQDQRLTVYTLKTTKDEILTVIRRVDENWAEGMLGDKIGIFPILYVELNETAKQLMEIDKPTPSSVPGPSSEPSPLGPCTPGPSPCSSPSNGNGASHRRVEGKKNAKKRHSFSALSVSQRTAQLNNRHSMEISHPVLISSSDPRAAARIQVISPAYCSISPCFHPSDPHMITEPAFCHVVLKTFPLFPPSPVGHVPPPLQPTFAPPLVKGEIPISGRLMLVFHRTAQASAAGDHTSSTPWFFLSLKMSQLSHQKNIIIYLALYAYKPQKADELELRKGEMYRVTEKCQDGWFKGTSLRTAASGVFPGNYVTPVSRSVRRASKKKRGGGGSGGGQLGNKMAEPASPGSPGPSSSRPSTPLVNAANSVSPASSPQSAAAQLKNCLRSSQHTVNQARTSMQLVHSPPAGSPERPTVAISPLRSQSLSPSRCPGQLGRPLSVVSPGPSLGPSPLPPLPGPSHVHTQSVLVPKGNLPQSSFPTWVCNDSNWLSGWTGETVRAVPRLQSSQPSLVPFQSPCKRSTTDDPDPLTVKEKKERKAGGLLKLLSGAAAKKKPRSPPSSPPTHGPSLAGQGAVATDPAQHGRSGSCPMASQGRAGSCPIESDMSGAIGLEPLHRKSGSLDTNFPRSPPATRAGSALMVLRPEPKPLSRESRYRVVVPYPPQSEAEIELREGDVVFVHKKREDGWFKGTLQRTGETGLFPSSFVESF
uniref:RING-type E3 ubiquitin transferase n=1 Tax=Tetraodon nigroviridis TaxID=99883 RepID=H3DG79_TETNG